jgi:hypothetical protein
MANFIKRNLKRALLSYAVLYLGASGIAVFDYHFFNPAKNGEDQPVTLDVRRFQTNIDGQEKRFTLVGEDHIYTKSEYQLGVTLVDEHDHFAGERASDAQLPKQDERFVDIADAIFYIPIKAHRYGSGRHYKNIDRIAEKDSHFVHGIEENAFDGMSKSDRLDILIWGLSGLVIAPTIYFQGRYEVDACPDLEDGFGRSLIYDRDPVLADGIVKLLHQDDIDNLLVSFGGCHVPGIVTELEKQLVLEPVSSYD